MPNYVSDKQSAIRLFCISFLLIVGCGRSDTSSVAPMIPFNLEAENQRVRSELRGQNKSLVNGCAQGADLARRVRVTGRSLLLCRAPNTHHGAYAGHTIARYGNGFSLTLRLGATIFPIGTTPQREDELFAKVRGCFVSIQEVYRRYDLHLDLRLDHETNPYDVHVNLRDGLGNSSAHQWYMQEDQICLILLHEISHLFGLDDEYEDLNCPDRPFISREQNPISIMFSPRAGFERVDLYPRHIQTIIDPFCPSQTGSPLGLTYTEATTL